MGPKPTPGPGPILEAIPVPPKPTPGPGPNPPTIPKPPTPDGWRLEWDSEKNMWAYINLDTGIRQFKAPMPTLVLPKVPKVPIPIEVPIPEAPLAPGPVNLVPKLPSPNTVPGPTVSPTLFPTPVSTTVGMNSNAHGGAQAGAGVNAGLNMGMGVHGDPSMAAHGNMNMGGFDNGMNHGGFMG